MPTKIYKISGTCILSGLLCLLWPTVRAQIGADARRPTTNANTNRRRTPPAPRRTPRPARTRPVPTANLQSSFTNQSGIEFVLIPAGSFMMGSENRQADERPVHQVTITQPFYMGRYEVTQAQWQRLMGTNPSHFRGDDLPAEQVSWDDVQVFLQGLNALNDGYTYRLPSEAEWEYACRARTTGDHAGSLDAMAWYDANSSYQMFRWGRSRRTVSGYMTCTGTCGNGAKMCGMRTTRERQLTAQVG